MIASRVFAGCLAIGLAVCGCSGASPPTPALASAPVTPAAPAAPAAVPGPLPPPPSESPIIVASALSQSAPAAATAGCPAPEIRAYEIAEDLGGLSGIAPADQPNEFVAISDAGGVYTLSLGDGGAQLTSQGRLAGLETATNSDRDAEALLRLPDGRWLVSFERSHRLVVFPPGLSGLTGGPATVVAVPDAWRALDWNRGVEALALAGDGRIVAIEEGVPLQLASRTAWRFDPPTGSSLDATSVTYSTGFAVAPGDAAGGNDGRIYVLEREITGLGLSARIARVTEAADGSLSVETTLDLSGSLPAANYEGMTVDPYRSEGRRFVLVSDGDDGARSIIVDIVTADCAF